MAGEIGYRLNLPDDGGTVPTWGVLRFVGRDLHILPMAKGSAGTFQRGCPKNSFRAMILTAQPLTRGTHSTPPGRPKLPPPQASQNLLAEPFKYNNRKWNRQLCPGIPQQQMSSPGVTQNHVPGPLLKNCSTHKLKDSQNSN